MMTRNIRPNQTNTVIETMNTKHK